MHRIAGAGIRAWVCALFVSLAARSLWKRGGLEMPDFSHFFCTDAFKVETALNGFLNDPRDFSNEGDVIV